MYDMIACLGATGEYKSTQHRDNTELVSGAADTMWDMPSSNMS